MTWKRISCSNFAIRTVKQGKQHERHTNNKILICLFSLLKKKKCQKNQTWRFTHGSKYFAIFRQRRIIMPHKKLILNLEAVLIDTRNGANKNCIKVIAELLDEKAQKRKLDVTRMGMNSMTVRRWGPLKGVALWRTISAVSAGREPSIPSIQNSFHSRWMGTIGNTANLSYIHGHRCIL